MYSVVLLVNQFTIRAVFELWIKNRFKITIQEGFWIKIAILWIDFRFKIRFFESADLWKLVNRDSPTDYHEIRHINTSLCQTQPPNAFWETQFSLCLFWLDIVLSPGLYRAPEDCVQCTLWRQVFWEQYKSDKFSSTGKLEPDLLGGVTPSYAASCFRGELFLLSHRFSSQLK